MASSTSIEWADCSWSPWTVCTEQSPACTNCYARQWARRLGIGWGRGVPRHRFSDAHYKIPFRWNAMASRNCFRECDVCGKREFRRASRELPIGIRCCSTPDCFSLPETESFASRPRVFPSVCDPFDLEAPLPFFIEFLDTVRRTPALDWLLLTKVPENFFIRIPAAMVFLTKPGNENHRLSGWLHSWFNLRKSPQNVWVGATVEDIPRSSRVAALVQIPARVRFLSCEPLFEPFPVYEKEALLIDWVIAGGESGRGARPSHPDAFRSMRHTCAIHRIPFFFKQWGEWSPRDPALDATGTRCMSREVGFPELIRRHPAVTMRRYGHKRTGRLLDGVLHHAFPS